MGFLIFIFLVLIQRLYLIHFLIIFHSFWASTRNLNHWACPIQTRNIFAKRLFLTIYSPLTNLQHGRKEFLLKLPGPCRPTCRRLFASVRASRATWTTRSRSPGRRLPWRENDSCLLNCLFLWTCVCIQFKPSFKTYKWTLGNSRYCTIYSRSSNSTDLFNLSSLNVKFVSSFCHP